jgi:two-component system sensor histidine kinase YesM
VRRFERWKIHVERLSLFQKMALVMAASALVTSFVTHAIVLTSASSLVRGQIADDSAALVERIVSQASENYARPVALLASLSADERVAQILSQSPQSKLERIQAVDAMRGRIIDSVNKMFDGNLMIAAVSTTGYAYANWDTQDHGLLLSMLDEYLDALGTGRAALHSLYTRVEKRFTYDAVGRKMDAYILIMPVYVRASRQLTGVVAAFLPLQRFAQILGEGDDWRVLLLTNADDVELASVGGEGDSSLALNKLDRGAWTGKQDGQYSDADRRFLITRKNATRAPLSVVSVVSEAYIRRQVWRLLRPLITSAAVTLCVTVWVGAWLMRGIARPLKELTEAFSERDYGSFEREHMDIGRNEVRLLARGFQEMRENIARLNEENARKEKEKRDLEIKALQAQIQPHFLFNTLNTTRCAILNGNSEKAADLVMKLTLLLRMTLARGAERVALREEIETVGYYADILRMRSGLTFEWISDVPEDLLDFPLPKLILQPLVENSVLHGFRQGQSGGVIHLTAERDQDALHIDVRNNGAPLETANLELDTRDVSKQRFSGMGISNVNDRLRLHYGETSGVSLFSQEGWTIARIRIALPGRTA